MLRSIRFDLAFLGVGGLLIAAIDVPAAVVSLAIGVFATRTYSATEARARWLARRCRVMQGEGRPMKAMLFGLIVIGMLMLIGCQAMIVQPDAPIVIDDAGYGRYAMLAPSGFHPFVDGDTGPWR